MRELFLFVEDAAQEKFLSALLRRIAIERSVGLSIHVRSARGGAGKVLTQRERFVRDAEDSGMIPDGLVVAIDANCRGYNEKRREISKRLGSLAGRAICAIPDPHIERWFLLDGEAFKAVLGRGCAAPDEKCEKQRYKKLLNAAIRAANVEPLLGGIEYAEDLADTCNIQRVAAVDASFGKFVGEVRSWLNVQVHQ